MAARPVLEYPSDDEIVDAVRRTGGVKPAADALGFKQPTLSKYVLSRPSLKTRVDEARRQHAASSLSPIVHSDEVSREELLEQELGELKQALARDRKGQVKDERLTQAVERALQAVPAPRRAKPAKSPATTAKGAPHHRQLTMWSDWHGGEVVDPDAVNGLNSYSWEIMEQRVDELVEGLLSHRANSPDLTGLDIVVGGDMNSGSNHRELAETNQYPLAEQGVRMGYLLGRSIERLVEHYRSIRVLSIVGNHPRLAMKPAAKNVHDNMDWVSGIIAREYLRDYPTVEVRCPTSAAAFHEIAGRCLYVWHGDGVRSSMPGVPWGGVMRRVNEIRRSHSARRIDGFLLGHFHQANAMLDLGIFMNGALKGTDEWVQKNFGGGAPPTQMLLTFDEKRSRLTNVGVITPTAGLP